MLRVWKWTKFMHIFSTILVTNMLITHYEKAFKSPQWNLSEVVSCSYTVGFLKFIYVLHMTRVNKKLERTRVMVENKGDRTTACCRERLIKRWRRSVRQIVINMGRQDADAKNHLQCKCETLAASFFFLGFLNVSTGALNLSEVVAPLVGCEGTAGGSQ